MQAKYKTDEETIRVLQTKVNLLSNELFSVTEEAEAEKSKLYIAENHELEERLEFHKLFADKIEAEKSLLSAIPKTAMVDIVDFARTPASPVGRDYSLAIALFIIGLFPTAGGFLLLKSSRRQFT